MDVPRVLLALTDVRVPFSKLRPVAVSGVKCRSAAGISSSQPPDLRKIFAGVMSMLVLLSSPSSASVLPYSRTTSAGESGTETRPLEQQFADIIRNPCQSNKNPKFSSHNQPVNYTLNILELVKIFSQVAQQITTNIINETLSPECSTLSFQPLVPINIPEIKRSDRRTALHELYRILLVYAGHVNLVFHQSRTFSENCDLYDPGRKDYLSILRNQILQTLCYTLSLEDLLEVRLDFTIPTNSVIQNTRFEQVQECSIRMTRDCDVIKNANVFLGHYREYIENVHSNMQSELYPTNS